MKTIRPAILVTVGLLLVGSVCTAGAAGDEPAKDATVKDAPAKVEPEVAATLGADGVQRAEILAGSYFFKPAHVVVKVNVPVELKVRKESGGAPHEIRVQATDAGVSFAVDLATEPKTISFTPTKVGTYPMYCGKRFLFFASHREQGMEGVLDVRE